jgi:hypothetical protein
MNLNSDEEIKAAVSDKLGSLADGDTIVLTYPGGPKFTINRLREEHMPVKVEDLPWQAATQSWSRCARFAGHVIFENITNDGTYDIYQGGTCRWKDIDEMTLQCVILHLADQKPTTTKKIEQEQADHNDLAAKFHKHWASHPRTIRR